MNHAKHFSKDLGAPEWDLSDFGFGNQREIDEYLAALKLRVDEFCGFYQKAPDFFLADADQLADAMIAYENIQQMADKIASFTDLQLQSDLENAEYSAQQQNTHENLTQILRRMVFFPLLLNQLPDDLHTLYICAPRLVKYRYWLEVLRQFKPYQLEETQEKLLTDKNITARAGWIKLYDEVEAGLRFNLEDDLGAGIAEGKNIAEILNMMQGHDPMKRKQAAYALGKGLMAQQKLFVRITNILAKDKAINDEWRGFSHAVQSRNLSNQVEDNVVDNLVASIQRNYTQSSHVYYQMKAEAMGYQKLPFWERLAPPAQADVQLIDFSQAKTIILQAFGDFSLEMAQIAQEFFTNGWIDAKLRPGKCSGAFSHPVTPNLHPYILMNYQGKPSDILTLAHELGHGIHQILARQQGHLLAETPLILAETASIFGENLVFESLMQQSSADQQEILLTRKIEDSLNSCIRQISFFTFERRVHDERANGELLPERLNQIWLQVARESLGDGVELDDDIYGIYWAYIPHFIHSPFYVYAYAFGECLVNRLYGLYQQGGDDFQQKYLTLLSAGGSDNYKNLLQNFGLDPLQDDFWDQALQPLISDIARLKRLRGK